ncbi:MAG: polyhydroxyalkanoate depolymerase [Armatimonadota bacterium]|nr:MAG: polyhydroxyalkanoate depolymerase [Armatimonadota bacterium]
MISEPQKQNPEWEQALQTLAAQRGRVMVLGARDVGKTTFTALLANRQLAHGTRVAVVDADVGQSEIGPPTTIGVGLVEVPVPTLHAVVPLAIYFVGSNTPRGRMLETVNGVRAMVAKAQEAGAESVLIDTTGFVSGAAARRLKCAKVEAVHPQFVVAIQRKDELEHILRPLEKRKLHLIRLPVPETVALKSPEMRQQRRMMRFFRYFQDARAHTFALSDIACEGTWFNTGTPLEWNEIHFLQDTLHSRVFWAERTSEHLFVITDKVVDERALVIVEETFRVAHVTTAGVHRFVKLLLGLLNAEGECLAIGILERIDFVNRTITVRTPLRDASGVAILRFGGLNVRPDGKEIGAVKPGEI